MKDSSKTGSSSAVDEHERLRDLILGEEKDRLHKLDRRVTDLELRTTDVAEVLPGAMNRLIQDPASKPDIERPIVGTIRGAIKRDTQSFAEALFPVLGPAIRRAVADALKSLVQRINVALENSFTVKGLRWRVEAARTGVPFAQIVLRHTFLYAVQEAFLIQRKSGLVLASVHRDESLALDEDAVSAMLTAIQAFIQDSFGVPSDEPLRSAELGDRTLWVINGPEAVLACVISGAPPRIVRDELMDLLEIMHARFGDRFNEHPEMLANHEGLHALMLEALREEADEAVSRSAGARYRLLWIAAGMALLVFLVWSGWTNYQERRLENAVAGLFGAEPGYVLTTHGFDGGRLTIAGLRDPLAADPERVLESGSLSPQGMQFDFRSYQSLDPEIVLRRLRGVLGLGEAVSLDLAGSTLSVGGQLSSAQYQRLEGLPVSHPVIQSVALENARLAADEAIGLITAELGTPGTVTVMPSGDRMVLSGSADADWFAGATAGAGSLGGWPLDFTPLKNTLQGQFDDLQEQLDGLAILFTRAYDLSPATQAELDEMGRALARLQSLSDVLGGDLSLRLEGNGDGVGTAEKNREVALNRAQIVLNGLQAQGVLTTGIKLEQGSWESGGPDPERRKVILHVSRITQN